ncbi:DNA repair protein RecO [Bacteroidales bacterium Barb6]|nr:DNA repair protein RecO [Bacteroidales bacterium Barb6]
MPDKTRGIVLHSIPYSDKYSIIYMYTEAFGRASYIVARNRGKKSSVSKSLFIPLSVLEMEVEHRPKRDLHRIRECKTCFPFMDISRNPIKNMLAQFLSELIYRAVKETEPDPRLFDYLYTSVHLLEHTEQGIANFHIAFLLGLLRRLGIFPHLETYRKDYLFDMPNGIFVDTPPAHPHCLNADESSILSRLLRISYENMNLYAFSRRERVSLIHRILDYYRLHLPEFPEIKSVAVLQTLFDA